MLDEELTRPPPELASNHDACCAACGKPLERGDRIVDLFGEALHSDCALWTLAQHQAVDDSTQSL
jgi:hypothetical protein